jgi:hypothetical protein
MLVEKATKNLQISEQDFNKEFGKHYINQHGLKIARDLYREFHIKRKLQEKIELSEKTGKVANTSKIEPEELECNVSWPLCVEAIRENRKHLKDIEIWTYRESKCPAINHDYIENAKK